MITIAELFPLYDTCVKWYRVRIVDSSIFEKKNTIHNRIVKEYTWIYKSDMIEAWYLVNKTKTPNFIIPLPFENTEYYRKNGPAITQINKDGTILCQWILHNNITKITSYHIDGNIKFQQEFLNKFSTWEDLL